MNRNINTSKRISNMSTLASLVLCCSAVVPVAQATEGGGSIYPMGAESFLTGALPPPGFYTLVYANHYNADKLKDNRGNTVPLDFKVSATAVVPRFVWVTDKVLFGGQVAHAILIPLVDLDVNVAGSGQKKTGVGDIDITAIALGYHHSANLHSTLGLEVMVPSGNYNKADLANIGRNYWAIQPVYAASYIDPAGWNADFKAMLDFNFKNTATHYKSGNELHVDYSLGYGFQRHWVAGIGGYAYKQISNDEQYGVTVPDNRGQAFAVGPTLKYNNAKGLVVMAKWQKEMSVRNRAEGHAFWIKAILPF